MLASKRINNYYGHLVLSAHIPHLPTSRSAPAFCCCTITGCPPPRQPASAFSPASHCTSGRQATSQPSSLEALSVGVCEVLHTLAYKCVPARQQERLKRCAHHAAHKGRHVLAAESIGGEVLRYVSQCILDRQILVIVDGHRALAVLSVRGALPTLGVTVHQWGQLEPEHLMDVRSVPQGLAERRMEQHMEYSEESADVAADVVGEQEDAAITERHPCWLEPRGDLEARSGPLPKHFDPDYVSYAQRVKNLLGHLLGTRQGD